MKRIIYLLLFVSAFAVNTQAQVTIGADTVPNENAVLELKSTTKGFLPPRVELTALNNCAPLTEHVEGMVVFNTKSDPAISLYQGIYYNNGTNWVRLSAVPGGIQWFYMPSFAIDASTTGPQGPIYLHAIYSEQFGSQTKSLGSPDLHIVPASGLYYYVLGYDEDVFEDVDVSPTGELNYTVKKQATDSTYMNIVFVIK